MVDLGKAVASQLIGFHHLALYGPMADVVDHLAGDLMAWLVSHARLAVQVFLVMGGFLAARTLLPSPQAPDGPAPGALGQTLARRLQRLMPPYLVALLAAVGAAWCARLLIDYPAIPEAPTVWQFLSNAVMLQDLLGEDALSAGFWYVAIDVQLHALLVLVCVVRARWGTDQGAWRGGLTVATLLVLTGASLLWLNRVSDLDVWAVYFMGAYGLGVLAQWACTSTRRGRWVGTIAALTVLALLVEWRSRVALAGCVALVLALDLGRGWRWLNGGPVQSVVAFLSRISYTVFLMHYPVSLVVGAVVCRLWPTSPALNLLGLVVAWGLSLLAGWGLQVALASAPQVPPSAWRASTSNGLSR